MINELFRDLSSLPQVEAIALGGSRAGIHFDESSDYDIYLYCTGPVPEEARRAIRLLGGELQGVERYVVPGTDAEHNIVLLRKVAPTPKQYPRRFAKIKSDPL